MESTTTCSDAAGGKITTVRSGRRAWCVRKRRMNAFASLGPTCIFQFAAKTGFFSGSAIIEDGHPGKSLSFEKLEGRPTACRDVAYGILEPGLRDGGRRIAPADDRRCASFRGVGERTRNG